MSLSLVRLEPYSPRKPFDCGNSDLNEFFLNDSINYGKELLAVTYALESEDETIAYFAVSNDSIRAEDTSNSMRRKILKILPFEKRGYKSHPAVKIGRFAVATIYQRQGIGTKLMDFIKFFFIDKNKTGCRFIVVDAYKEAINFYKNNGFDFLTMNDKDKDTRLMYFDLITFIRTSKSQTKD